MRAVAPKPLFAALIALPLVASAPASARAPLPDLVVARTALAPSSAAAGGRLRLSAAVANRGRGRAGRSVAGFYLRSGGRSTLVDRVAVPALRPGGRSAVRASLSLPAAIVPGRYRLIACADDRHQVREQHESGGCAASAGLLTVHAPTTIETTPTGDPTGTTPSTDPTLPGGLPKPVSLDTPADGAITASATPGFSGRADASQAVTVKVTGASARTLTAAPAPDGSWSVAASPALPDGGFSATAEQAGASPSPAHGFTVDTTAPSVDVTLTPATPNGSGGFYRSLPRVHVTADDANYASIACTVDGASAQPSARPAGSAHDADGDLAVSGDGTHTATCSARDRAGNVSADDSVTFKLDSAAPVVGVTAPAAGATTSDQTPTFSGTAGRATGDATSVTVKLYGGAATSGTPLQTLGATRDGAGNWTTAAASRLPVGAYTAVASQPDSAGNTGTATRAFFVPAVLLAAGDIAACDQTGDSATAALLGANPADRIAALGDNAYEDGSTADFTNCFGPTWGVFKPLIAPAAGNHEYSTGNANDYFSYFGAAAGTAGQGWYSYDLGSWHVIVLNSSNGCNPVACDAGSAQLTWLHADLAAHSNTCTLAYWHHPLFSSDANPFAGETPAVKPFWDELYAAGADLVLNGHSHVYERFAPQAPDGTADAANGLTELIAGTGGYSEHALGTPVPNSQVRNNDTFGLLRLVLRPAGYSYRFLPAAGGGTFTDSGTGVCH